MLLAVKRGKCWDMEQPTPHLLNRREKLPPNVCSRSKDVSCRRFSHFWKRECIQVLSDQSSITKNGNSSDDLFHFWRNQCVERKYWCTLYMQRPVGMRGCRRGGFQGQDAALLSPDSIASRLKKSWRERPSPRVMGNNGRRWRFRKRIGMWEWGGGGIPCS